MIVSQTSYWELMLSELFLMMAVGGTILAIVVFVFTLALRRASASIRFAILRLLFCGWLVMPVLALAAPSIPLGWQLNWRSNQPPPKEFSSLESQVPSGPLVALDEEASPMGNPERSLPSGISSTRTPNLVALPNNESSPIQPSRPVEHPEVRGEEFSNTMPYPTRIFWLAGWLVVAIFILLRQLVLWNRVRKVVKSAIPIEAGEIAWRAGLHLRELGKVKFYLSNQFSAPVTTGIRTPVVLLAANSLKLEKEVLKMVVRHELAHVERRDVLWQSVFSLANAVYWFHPLVWFANRCAKRERELACDDVVLASGAQPEIYASVLLDHAAAATGRPVQWGAAIPMARIPLQYRIKSILDRNTCRRFISLRFSSIVVTAMTLLVTVVGVVRPFQEPQVLSNEHLARTQDAGDGSTDIHLPKLVSGTIVDEQGQPLEGVKIELQYTTWTEDTEVFVSRREDHRTWELITDEKGVYTLDTTGLDSSKIQLDHSQLNFIGWASLGGRVGQPVIQSGKYVVERGELRPVVLPLGRLVSGRVRPPANAAGQELMNPRVRVSGPDHWTSRPLLCDQEGRFSLFVPQVGEVEILAFADNFAATRVFAGKDSDLGDIELQHGVRVSGQVLDADGYPVSGVVVSIRNDRFNEISQLHRNGKLLPHAAVKTEMDGRFQFPPHVGPCTIAVVNASRTHDADSDFLNVWANRKPPVVLPKSIDLDGSVESLQLSLQEVDTITVSGTVRWPDGRGASGIELRGSVMAGGQGIELDHATTNGKGEYELRFPVDSEISSILCLGARDSDSVWHYADPSNELDARQKSRQIMGLHRLSSNVTGADWALVKKESPARVAEVSARARASENALAEIASRYHRTRVEDRDHSELTAEVLELEESYRGESAALNALRMSLRWTKESTNATSRANYQEAIRRLQEYYLTHPELDGVMSELSTQFDLDGSIKFLHAVEKGNPHPQVQASAVLYQMQLWAEQVETIYALEEKNWEVEGLDNFPLEYQMEVHRLIPSMKAVDPTELRNRIEEISKRLKNEFGDLKRQTFVSYVQSFRQRRYAPDDMEPFGELADRIMFRVLHLRPGEIIDDFAGTDVDGNQFKLSDFRGKVVVLMFSANWCQPCKAMYPENRKLVAAYKDRPFQMISVMGDQQADTVAAAVGSGEITWLTTWDGKKGPIATKWNINSWPTVYVIDHLGVIRSLETDSKVSESLIEDLVQRAEGQ